MTLKQLEAFYWAATLGNFGIAAERLHITQSSLSKRIAELESALGQVLFDRSRKRTALTEAGTLLLPRCRALLEMLQQLGQALEEELGEAAIVGPCRFGISELSASTWLPRFVHAVRDAHPALVLEPHILLTAHLEQLVQRGELDFAVIAGRPGNPALDSEAVARVPFTWVASPRALQAGTLLTAAQLSQLDVLTHPPDSGLARVLDGWLALNGLKIRRAIVCNSLNTITGLAVGDMGVSFLPSPYVRPLIERGKLIALRSEPALPAIDYHLVWLREDIRPITKVMRRLVAPAVDFEIPNDLWR